MNWKLCSKCALDPDPRGPSACHDCREINTPRGVPVEAVQRAAGLYRAIQDHVAAIRVGDLHALALTELALDGAVSMYRQPDGPDMSDAHVDRIARRLYRAFDDASRGKEPLHDFDVMAQCAYEGRPVIDNWRALARAAIQIGAVIPEEDP